MVKVLNTSLYSKYVMHILPTSTYSLRIEVSYKEEDTCVLSLCRPLMNIQARSLRRWRWYVSLVGLFWRMHVSYEEEDTCGGDGMCH